eukprot:UC4_evm2s329
MRIICNSGIQAITEYTTNHLEKSSLVKRSAWALQSLTTIDEARPYAMRAKTHILAINILKMPVNNDENLIFAQSYACNLLASLAAGDVKDPYRDTLLAEGAAKVAVVLFSSPLPEARAHGAHALRNLSYGSAERVAKVMAAGAAPHLVSLLINGGDGEQERSSRALWNLAFSEDARPALVAAGAVEALEQAQMSKNSQTRQNATVAYALLTLGSSRFKLAGAGKNLDDNNIESLPYIQKFIASEFGAVTVTSYEQCESKWSDPENPVPSNFNSQ